ncbi:putative low-density lipoprotein receptor-related protein [Paratrimastix pyriformis]|uniref:Low-density lipoprotein receptor-related protein n=1 Tax=Paratrimastix pyriformis TaxID=342808 RepID=A0ABQ8UXI5_9EUKA|nr:putative low-density lipoprotein receptor-related protein [Paratrimastix pyriformis]
MASLAPPKFKLFLWVAIFSLFSLSAGAGVIFRHAESYADVQGIFSAGSHVLFLHDNKTIQSFGHSGDSRQDLGRPDTISCFSQSTILFFSDDTLHSFNLIEDRWTANQNIPIPPGRFQSCAISEEHLAVALRGGSVQIWQRSPGGYTLAQTLDPPAGPSEEAPNQRDVHLLFAQTGLLLVADGQRMDAYGYRPAKGWSHLGPVPLPPSLAAESTEPIPGIATLGAALAADPDSRLVAATEIRADPATGRPVAVAHLYRVVGQDDRAALQPETRVSCAFRGEGVVPWDALRAAVTVLGDLVAVGLTDGALGHTCVFQDTHTAKPWIPALLPLPTFPNSAAVEAAWARATSAEPQNGMAPWPHGPMHFLGGSNLGPLRLSGAALLEGQPAFCLAVPAPLVADQRAVDVLGTLVYCGRRVGEQNGNLTRVAPPPASNAIYDGMYAGNCHYISVSPTRTYIDDLVDIRVGCTASGSGYYCASVYLNSYYIGTDHLGQYEVVGSAFKLVNTHCEASSGLFVVTLQAVAPASSVTLMYDGTQLGAVGAISESTISMSCVHADSSSAPCYAYPEESHLMKLDQQSAAVQPTLLDVGCDPGATTNFMFTLIPLVAGTSMRAYFRGTAGSPVATAYQTLTITGINPSTCSVQSPPTLLILGAIQQITIDCGAAVCQPVWNDKWNLRQNGGSSDLWVAEARCYGSYYRILFVPKVAAPTAVAFTALYDGVTSAGLTFSAIVKAPIDPAQCIYDSLPSSAVLGEPTSLLVKCSLSGTLSSCADYPQEAANFDIYQASGSPRLISVSCDPTGDYKVAFVPYATGGVQVKYKGTTVGSAQTITLGAPLAAARMTLQSFPTQAFVGVPATFTIACTAVDGGTLPCLKYPGEAANFDMVQTPTPSPQVDVSCDPSGQWAVRFVPRAVGTAMLVRYQGTTIGSSNAISVVLPLTASNCYYSSAPTYATLGEQGSFEVCCKQPDNTLQLCGNYPGEASNFELVQAGAATTPRLVDVSCDAVTGCFRVGWVALAVGSGGTLGVTYKGTAVTTSLPAITMGPPISADRCSYFLPQATWGHIGVIDRFSIACTAVGSGSPAQSCLNYPELAIHFDLEQDTGTAPDLISTYCDAATGRYVVLFRPIAAGTKVSVRYQGTRIGSGAPLNAYLVADLPSWRSVFSLPVMPTVHPSPDLPSWRSVLSLPAISPLDASRCSHGDMPVMLTAGLVQTFSVSCLQADASTAQPCSAFPQEDARFELALGAGAGNLVDVSCDQATGKWWLRFVMVTAGAPTATITLGAKYKGTAIGSPASLPSGDPLAAARCDYTASSPTAGTVGVAMTFAVTCLAPDATTSQPCKGYPAEAHNFDLAQTPAGPLPQLTEATCDQATGNYLLTFVPQVAATALSVRYKGVLIGSAGAARTVAITDAVTAPRCDYVSSPTYANTGSIYATAVGCTMADGTTAQPCTAFPLETVHFDVTQTGGSVAPTLIGANCDVATGSYVVRWRANDPGTALSVSYRGTKIGASGADQPVIIDIAFQTSESPINPIFFRDVPDVHARPYTASSPTEGNTGVAMTYHLACLAPDGSTPQNCRLYPDEVHNFGLSQTPASPLPRLIEAGCDQATGEYTLTFVPLVASTAVSAQYKGTNIGAGAAARAVTIAAAITPAQCTCTGVPALAVWGHTYTVLITCLQAGVTGTPPQLCSSFPQEAANFEVVTATSGAALRVSGSGCAAATDEFRVSFTPTAGEGSVALAVRYQGLAMDASCDNGAVAWGDIMTAPRCSYVPSAPTTAQTGEPLTLPVTCTAPDGTTAQPCTAYPGEAHNFALVQNPTSNPPRVIETTCDAATGEYRLTLVPQLAATALSVAYKGVLIGDGNPRAITVSRPIDPWRTTFSHPTQATAGAPFAVTLDPGRGDGAAAGGWDAGTQGRPGAVQMNGSPRTIPVLPDVISAGACTVAGWPATAQPAGAVQTLDISAFDAHANPVGCDQYPGYRDAFTVTLTGVAHFSVECNGASYRMRFTPTIVGASLTVPVLFNGAAVAGSPFTLTVVPGAAHPALTTVDWAGVTAPIVAGLTSTFPVDVRDVYGNLIACNAAGAPVLTGVLRALPGGDLTEQAPTLSCTGTQYAVSVVAPAVAGVHPFAVRLRWAVGSSEPQDDVLGSPHPMLVEPGAIVAARSLVAGWPALGEPILVGVLRNITVLARDALDNVVPCPSHPAERANFGVSPLGAQTWFADASGVLGPCQGDAYLWTIRPELIPAGASDAGEQLAMVTYSGDHVIDPPRVVTVRAGPIDPTMSTVVWPATATAGTRATATVTAHDVYGNRVSCGLTSQAADFRLLLSEGTDPQFSCSGLDYALSLVPHRAGTGATQPWRLVFGPTNADLSNSPLTSLATAPGPIALATTTAAWPAPGVLVAGSPATVMITPRDADGNQVACTALEAGRFALVLPGADAVSVDCLAAAPLDLVRVQFTPHRTESPDGTVEVTPWALMGLHYLGAVAGATATPQNHIADSHHTVAILGAPGLSAATTSLAAPGEGLAPALAGAVGDPVEGHLWMGRPTQVVVGVPLRLRIVGRDSDGNPLSCADRPALAATLTVTLTGATDLGVTCLGPHFVVTLVPHRAGSAESLSIAVGASPIVGSPFVMTVLPGPIDPTTTTAHWPDPPLYVQQLVRVRVVARDSDSNVVSCIQRPQDIMRFLVSVSASELAEPDFAVTCAGSAFLVTFRTPSASGVWYLSIQVAPASGPAAEIVGSRSAMTLEPGPVSVTNILTELGADARGTFGAASLGGSSLLELTAGVPFSFWIRARDAALNTISCAARQWERANFTVALVLLPGTTGSGGLAAQSITCNGPLFQANLTPHRALAAGQALLTIQYQATSLMRWALYDSPYQVMVHPGALSGTTSSVIWPTVDLVVGAHSSLLLMPRDADGNLHNCPAEGAGLLTTALLQVVLTGANATSGVAAVDWVGCATAPEAQQAATERELGSAEPTPPAGSWAVRFVVSSPGTFQAVLRWNGALSLGPAVAVTVTSECARDSQCAQAGDRGATCLEATTSRSCHCVTGIPGISPRSGCVCPAGTPFRCPLTGRCAENRADCRLEQCWHDRPVMCWDSTCAVSFAECPCPPMYPFRCPDGRCAGNATACAVGLDKEGECPMADELGMNRYGCWNSSCVATALECPPPAQAPVRCADGLVAESRAVCEAECPQGKVRCWDSTCRPTWAQCPCPPERSYRCPDGQRCARVPADCAARCPSGAPIRCWDSSCAPDVTRCPCVTSLPFRCPSGSCARNMTGCPDAALIPSANNGGQCWDGTCAPDASYCPCRPETPYRCLTSGACVRSLDQCSNTTSQACPAAPTGGTLGQLCWDGSCASSFFSCPCPPHRPYRCDDRTCAASRPHCPAPTSGRPSSLCPAPLLQCGDGSCRASDALCPAPIICPPGYALCPNRILCVAALSACPLAGFGSLSCPTAGEASPVNSSILCPDHQTCVADLADCPSFATCPEAAPYFCANSRACVDQPAACPPPTYTNLTGGPCPTGQILCSFGVCRVLAADCPSQITCPGDRALCPDGSCATNASLCLPLAACPSGTSRCPLGECRAPGDPCGSPPTCPPGLPVLCPDLSCRAHVAACPVVPEGAQGEARCPDGSFVADRATMCPGMPIACPDETPVRCAGTSITCAAHAADCPSPLLCTDPYNSLLCPNGTRCVADLALCPELTYCPPWLPIRCLNQTCVATPGECPPRPLTLTQILLVGVGAPGLLLVIVATIVAIFICCRRAQERKMVQPEFPLVPAQVCHHPVHHLIDPACPIDQSFASHIIIIIIIVVVVVALPENPAKPVPLPAPFASDADGETSSTRGFASPPPPQPPPPVRSTGTAGSSTPAAAAPTPRPPAGGAAPSLVANPIFGRADEGGEAFEEPAPQQVVTLGGGGPASSDPALLHTPAGGATRATDAALATPPPPPPPPPSATEEPEGLSLPPLPSDYSGVGPAATTEAEKLGFPALPQPAYATITPGATPLRTATPRASTPGIGGGQLRFGVFHS